MDNKEKDINKSIIDDDDVVLVEDIDDILAEYQRKEAAKADKRASLSAQRTAARRRTRRYEPQSYDEDDSDEIPNTQILPTIDDAVLQESEIDLTIDTDDDEIPNTEILPNVFEIKSTERDGNESDSRGYKDSSRDSREAVAEEQGSDTKNCTADTEDTDELPFAADGLNDADIEPTKVIAFTKRQERQARKEQERKEQAGKEDNRTPVSVKKTEINNDRTPVPVKKTGGSNDFGKIPVFEEIEPESEDSRQALRGMHEEKPEQQPVKDKKPVPWKKILGGIAAIAAVVLIGAYGYGVYYYTNHFLPATAVNDVRVDNLTAAEAEQLLSDSKTVEDQTMYLLTKDGETAAMSTQPMGIRRQYQGVPEAIAAQQKWLFPISKDEWKAIDLDYQTVFDKEKAHEALQALEICDPEKMQQPVDACVVKDEKTGTYVIQPPVDGDTIDLDILAAAVTSAVENKQNTVDIAESGAYLTAAVREDDPQLNHIMTAENSLEKAEMKIDMGAGYILTLTPDDLRRCLKDGAVEETDPAPDALIDDARFAAFMDRFARMYTTKSASGYRNFLSVTGKKHAVQTDYGWEMDREEIGKQIYVLFYDAAAKALADPDYKETYPAHQVKAVWLQEAKTHGLRDTGTTWVEVDLTEQKLYCVVDDAVVLTSDVVSGMDSVPARRTPTGFYEIRFKTTGRYLTGYKSDGSISYRSYVNYWMPFYNNIGLHDATWRYAFGGDIYKQSGSHGCVNMPLKAAKEIYQIVYRGMPVIVYK